MKSDDLSKLKPSTQDPIPLETLRGLPLGGIYVYGQSHIPVMLSQWGDRTVKMFRFDIAMGKPGHGPAWHDILALDEFRYPRISRVAFSLTTEQMETPGDQPSGRCKSVTRRKKEPTWAKPGALFLAIDRGRRSRKQAPSRGLGVFSIASARTQQRFAWSCRACGLSDFSRRPDAFRPQCRSGCLLPLERFDTLTPEELALEGFPGMSADAFWELLGKAGNVAEDGTCCRLSFEAVVP